MHDAPAFTAVLFGLRGCLVETANDVSAPAPGALAMLADLHSQQVPCIWLDEPGTGESLTRVLPSWLPGHSTPSLPWPAPNACWQALMQLNSAKLDGSVLVSGDPRLLESALKAGLWAIGLAACSPRCEASAKRWQAMTAQAQQANRGKATLELFKLGAHSVIDHLEALQPCLADIAQRRRKGEKP